MFVKFWCAVQLWLNHLFFSRHTLTNIHKSTKEKGGLLMLSGKNIPPNVICKPNRRERRETGSCFQATAWKGGGRHKVRRRNYLLAFSRCKCPVRLILKTLNSVFVPLNLNFNIPRTQLHEKAEWKHVKRNNWIYSRYERFVYLPFTRIGFESWNNVGFSQYM